MLGTLHRQSDLFFTPLANQLDLLKDDVLDAIDALLDDSEIVELVRERLATRRPRSRRTGRKGIAADRLLRCCVLKHIKAWSFRELEYELRANLLYRRFTRFDADPIPDHCTFSRTFALLGPELTGRIQQRTVQQARHDGVATGQKMRTDTTVVETNVHYPTDSSQLGDGVRVLTRAMQHVAEQCESGAIRVVDHSRAVKRRLLEISRAAKSKTDEGRERMKESYGKLLVLTRRVTGQASKLLGQLRSGTLPVIGSTVSVIAQEASLRHFLPLVQKVIAQTKERLFDGNVHVENKVLSLFEPHTQVICKGKAHKPSEFGRLVRLDEVEGGIVSNYEVVAGNQADTDSFVPAIEQHIETFGRAPKMATADRGYFSAENEKTAHALGVKKVAVPARGRLSNKRRELHKERWFRRAMSWRAVIEGRIGTLKHRFGMLRATYKGEAGFERYVAWCVIANNLVSIGRRRVRRTES